MRSLQLGSIGLGMVMAAACHRSPSLVGRYVLNKRQTKERLAITIQRPVDVDAETFALMKRALLGNVDDTDVSLELDANGTLRTKTTIHTRLASAHAKVTHKQRAKGTWKRSGDAIDLEVPHESMTCHYRDSMLFCKATNGSMGVMVFSKAQK